MRRVLRSTFSFVAAEIFQPLLIFVAYLQLGLLGLFATTAVLMIKLGWELHRQQRAAYSRLRALARAYPGRDQRLDDALARNGLEGKLLPVLAPETLTVVAAMRIMPGSPPYLLATRRALDLLDDVNEQRGAARTDAMLMHELSHLLLHHKRWADLALFAVASIALVAAALLLYVAWQVGIWAFLLALVAAALFPSLAAMAYYALRRHFEWRADGHAVRTVGAGPLLECLDRQRALGAMERQASRLLGAALALPTDFATQLTAALVHADLNQAGQLLAQLEPNPASTRTVRLSWGQRLLRWQQYLMSSHPSLEARLARWQEGN